MVKYMKTVTDKYFIQKNIDKFNKSGYTCFLDGLEQNTIKNIFNKEHISYNIYEPFIDSDYKCFYKDEIPDVTCFEIITHDTLKHSDIMGTLYNFNISEDMIGDIIITDKYYFIVMSEMASYILDNLHLIGKYPVKLKVTNIPIYERKYIDNNYIVSSPRIDTVIAHITNLNRREVNDIIDRKDVIINYNILTNKSYILKDNDTFSVRRYGKYKYMGIIKTTKKDNIIINIKKYN